MLSWTTESKGIPPTRLCIPFCILAVFLLHAALAQLLRSSSVARTGHGSRENTAQSKVCACPRQHGARNMRQRAAIRMLWRHYSCASLALPLPVRAAEAGESSVETGLAPFSVWPSGGGRRGGTFLGHILCRFWAMSFTFVCHKASFDLDSASTVAIRSVPGAPLVIKKFNLLRSRSRTHRVPQMRTQVPAGRGGRIPGKLEGVRIGLH